MRIEKCTQLAVVWASVQSVTDCISLDSEGLAKGSEY